LGNDTHTLAFTREREHFKDLDANDNFPGSGTLKSNTLAVLMNKAEAYGLGPPHGDNLIRAGGLVGGFGCGGVIEVELVRAGGAASEAPSSTTPGGAWAWGRRQRRQRRQSTCGLSG